MGLQDVTSLSGLPSKCVLRARTCSPCSRTWLCSTRGLRSKRRPPGPHHGLLDRLAPLPRCMARRRMAWTWVHLQICIIVHFFSEQVRARVQGPEVVLARSSRTSSALFGRVQGPEVVFASSSRGPARPTLVPPVSLVTPDQLQNTRARAQAARQPTRDVSRTLRWVVNAVSAFPLSEPPPRNRKWRYTAPMRRSGARPVARS